MMKWEKTTREVYSTIYTTHARSLVPFVTISHPNGDPFGNLDQARMYTEWGFRDADYPIMASNETWEIDRALPNQRNEWDCTYWLCVPEKEEDR